jgi:PAS domain S-box-containing protein
VRWSAGAEALFGHSAAEVIGRPITLLIPPDRLGEEAELLRRISQGQRVRHFETERVRKDGTVVRVWITVSPVRDAEGRIVGASKIARDVTERARASRQLESQVAQLRLLHKITLAIGKHQDLQDIYQVAVQSVESRMPLDFAAICDADIGAGRLSLVCAGRRGRARLREMGLEPGDEIAAEPSDLQACTGAAPCWDNSARTAGNLLLRYMALRAGLESVAVVPLRSEQQTFALLLAARKPPDSFVPEEVEFLSQLGAHIGLAARQAELLAELQAAHEAFDQVQRQTAQSERSSALARMASGVAHDIDNALVVAQHFVKTLLVPQASLPSTSVENAGHALRSMEDIGAMASRLRRYAYPRQRAALLSEVQLNDLLPQVMAAARARVPERPMDDGASIEIELNLHGQLPKVLASESEIREALLNLVFNAVDAMPQGGRLALNTHWEPSGADQGRVRVEVVDSGNGMAPEVVARCLDPFFTTKGERGSGMGLTMVLAIAQGCGAELGIASEPGRGTTASLRFPVAQGRAP